MEQNFSLCLHDFLPEPVAEDTSVSPIMLKTETVQAKKLERGPQLCRDVTNGTRGQRNYRARR